MDRYIDKVDPISELDKYFDFKPKVIDMDESRHLSHNTISAMPEYLVRMRHLARREALSDLRKYYDSKKESYDLVEDLVHYCLSAGDQYKQYGNNSGDDEVYVSSMGRWYEYTDLYIFLSVGWLKIEKSNIDDDLH